VEVLAKLHPSEVFAGSDVGGAHEVYGAVLPLEEAQQVARVVSHVNSHCLYKCLRASGQLTSPPTDFHLFKTVVSPVSITPLSPPPLIQNCQFQHNGVETYFPRYSCI
jgi:hypothetical protein